MAREISPWEGKLRKSTQEKIELGRITEVDVPTRTCRVKTAHKDYRNVQWLALSASSTGEGDEDTFIPRPGQYCIILLVDGEPYIGGFYRPTAIPAEEADVKAKEDPEHDEEALINPGDRIIRTMAGNKLILRSGGTVELHSTGLCRSIWSPSGNTLTDICGQYELETEAGFVYAERDDDTDDTVYGFFMYDSLTPKNAVDFQAGKTDNDSYLYQLKLGPVDPATLTMTPSFLLGIGSNGDITLNSLASSVAKVDMKVEASTGNITQKLEGTVTQEITGDLVQKIKGKLNQEVTGDATQTVSGNLKADVTGNVNVDAKGDIQLKEAGGGELKLSKGQVALGASAGELLALCEKQVGSMIDNASSFVATSMGPGILNPGIVATLAEIKATLGIIKGSL
jgi:phage baseplate assembly protein gpV